MTNRPFTKQNAFIPELNDIIEKYGVLFKEKPIYVVFGDYQSKLRGRVHGIIAATANEFHAFIIKREVNKSGKAIIARSEFHPDGMEFNMQLYFEKIEELKRKKEIK